MIWKLAQLEQGPNVQVLTNSTFLSYHYPDIIDLDKLAQMEHASDVQGHLMRKIK